MASFRKQGNKWRAEVVRMGLRQSASFATKAEAQAWATRVESDILNAKHEIYPKKTLAEVFDEYLERVSSKKEGYIFEARRIEHLKRCYPWLVHKVVSEIKPADWSKWRDTRLETVSGSSVNRDLNLYSNVFQVAHKEWGYCGPSPISSIKRPKENPEREQRIHWQDVKRICRHLGYRTSVIPRNKNEEIAYAFLVGLRTAMRVGEILSLSDDNVDLTRRVATVQHKMQYQTGRPKQVPFTKQAARLLGVLSGRGDYFSIGPASRDAMFRKAKAELGLNEMHFHDTRAEALTLLSRKVDVYTLQRISGIKDVRILMTRYYRETAEQVAARL